MDKYRFRRCNQKQERQSHSNSDETIEFLLRTEDQMFQSISVHAALPEVLNRICAVLDCEIGNVVSLISVLNDDNDDAVDLAAIAGNAEHFGLHGFCSAGIFTENDLLLGSLEMYCCIARSPSIEEFQLIERAACLAAIAIDLSNEEGNHGNLKRPIYVN